MTHACPGATPYSGFLNDTLALSAFFQLVKETNKLAAEEKLGKENTHVIKKELGLQGSAARYGGEEFAILLPKAKLGDAIELADHIRKVISERIIKNKNTGANFGRITMSFGVTSMNANMTADDLIQKSDSALYLSKANGRNMVQSELELDQVVDGKQSA